jgi:hypothetical protein
MAQAKQASKEGAKRETQRASERASNNDDEGDGGENNTRGAFLPWDLWFSTTVGAR